ncbi:hypothetical protein [Nostoc sp. MG11]
MVEGEYQVSQFRQGDRLISPIFPDLNLTADQILTWEDDAGDRCANVCD